MNDILEFILNSIGIYLREFINFVTSPILILIRKFIPDFSSYFATLTNFLETYLFKGFQFVKMCFLNISNISIPIFSLFTLTFLFIIYLCILVVVFRLAYNVWQLYRGTKKGT